MISKKINKEIKKKLIDRKTIFGGWMSFSDPSIAEMFSSINLDFVAIDMEHTSISLEQAKNIISNCNLYNKPCFPRPSSYDKSNLKPILDIGSNGLIATTIESCDDVENCLNNLKYPPIGNRSYGVNKAQNYGLAEREYFKNWNNYSSLILQIETVKGLNDLENILVNFKKYIDGIMIGPYDLSGSMGIPGNLNSPKIIEAEKYIINLCTKNKISCGTQLSSFDNKIIKNKIKFGYNFLILGSDLFILKNWCLETQKLIQKVK
ncbi:MAG: 4-hydroxy-2-oxovalerate aldolase [Candidatus Pelagibacter sp.]|nr:4-hydroxy-2-oxovalerate aldolase [Candidatus Pelagibacter sp.]OUV88682.1 MAG: hypothetical protein CBC96_00235 [Pelagibacteraceae bacterium TMED136]|tara:strand:+ start:775 stop:1563 length:789 start_codon:yes stop_codon:yes gene_type:complete